MVLCIYVLRSQKGLARYHFVISYYDYFEKVLLSEFYYYGSLADYVIDMSNCETYVFTTKKYTSVMIRVCHSRSRFLSCMYIHDKFMTESR